MRKFECLRPSILYVDKPEDFVTETGRVKKALDKATEAHQGQFRKSGEPYVSHCIAVASILESWGLQQKKHEDLFCAAFLHDADEDTHYGLERIKVDFGNKVAYLVGGVSKFRSEKEMMGSEVDKETLKKVVMGTFIDPKVGILKLADRLHNMRTLMSMREDKRIAKAWETLMVYVPLAESLGMWVVKTELEDLAFSYIDPVKYETSRVELDGDGRLDENFIINLVQKTENLLKSSGLSGEVGIRAGGYWKSIKKRERAGMKGLSGLGNFSDINDVLSLRVKLDSVDDCYRFLGVLRQYFGDLVDETRADDFISIAPRDNGYMALQETINLNEGAIEVAIMTEEMEDFNNWGVVSLLRQADRGLSDYQLKLIFTPAGDVRFLPIGANGIDLAASLNKSLLASMVGVRVDDEDWDLSRPLPNGVTVEVVSNGGVETGRVDGLLNYTLLPRTRRMVEELLMRRDNNRLVEIGKGLMEEMLRERGLFCLEDISGLRQGWDRMISRILFEFGCEDLRELHYKVACGALGSERLAELLDGVGISKTGLGLVSIRLSGINRQGVLAGVSSVVNSVGGDVVNLKLAWDEENKYKLKLVVGGLLGNEEEITEQLKKGEWSEKIEVV